MATAHHLPAALRDKLAAAARRVRLLRALRGLSLVALALLLTGGAALLLDAWRPLPGAARLVLLAGWLALAAGLLVFVVVRPLCRRIDAEALAAVIEEKYPDLGERLTTSVELAGAAAYYHGSRNLIDLLIQETEIQTGPLDFLQALPARHAVPLAAAAGCCLLLAAAAGFIWSDALAAGMDRFLHPLRVPPAEVPYTLHVQPGDVFAARGRPITLTVRLQPRAEGTALPGTSTLLITHADGGTARPRMPAQPDQPDTFAVKLDQVPGDFRYQVEAGGVQSDSFQVTAVEPVELTADSPAVTITPPEYALAGRPPATVHGLADLSALQHSTVRFDFRFRRPAEKAYLIWSAQSDQPAATAPGDLLRPCDLVPFRRAEELPPCGGGGAPSRASLQRAKAEEPAEIRGAVHALPLSPDRLSATIELPAQVEGQYRLVLEAEHGIRTVLDPRPVAVQVDQPPVFVRVIGTDHLGPTATGEADPAGGKAHQATPYDSIPLEVIIADDVGVALAEIEYRVNDGPSQFEPIRLQGQGTPRAFGKHVFALKDKVKDGGLLRYRIKAADNRRLSAAGLEPQLAYHPAGDWLTLQIDRQAEPLKQQEVAAQKEDLDRRLADLIDRLKAEQRSAYKLKMESARQMKLTPDQAEALQQLQKENHGIDGALRELARALGETPALRPVADKAQDVADRELVRADAALQQAGKEAATEPRREQLAAADRELGSAIDRLEALRKSAERAVQSQVDPIKLQQLADRQQQLAEKTKDPDARNQAEQLRQQQGELARDLQKLTEQSENLRQAMEELAGDRAKQLAEQAEKLAQQQRELAEQSKPQPTARDAELARKQQELAEQAAKLARQTQQAAQTARTRPLEPDAAQQAAEALKRGDVEEARKLQERVAKELERFGSDFSKAAELARDPKEAARQLARLEEALEKRLQDELKKKDPATLPERLGELERDQKAIQRAAEQLSVPPQNQGAQQRRQEVVKRADQAAEALHRHNPQQAAEQMKQTREALNQLANQLPTAEQRRQQALQEVTQLRREQEQIQRQAEQAARDFEKRDPNAAKTRDELAQRLSDAARRQAEAAQRLGKLDAPNQEARQERTQEALNRALADLMDARPQDVAASQQDARRQLERLEQALKGEKPADEKAQELADRQRQLAKQAARAANDPAVKPEELKRQQQQIANEVRNLQAPEAPQRQQEAAQATRQAEQSASKNPTSPETHKQMEQAAQALECLAQQLAGQESDAQRAQRLAQRQAEAVAEAQHNPAQAQGAEAQRRRQQIQEEARQLRAGENGQAEKQKALEALNRAGQQPQSPEAQRQAADALRELADRMAGRNNDAARAEQIAREQRELANQAARPEAQKPNPQAARQAAERQQDLEWQLHKLDPKSAPEAQKQAGQQMQKARRALEQAKATAEAQKQLEQAAQAAEQLARQLQQPAANQPQPNPQPANNPSPRQQARELARQQRQLAQQTQQARQQAQKQPGPQGQQAQREALQRLAEQQERLNQRASQLPANQNQQALQQARQAMNQAEQALNRNDLQQAQQRQQEAAQALERLAQKLSDQPQQARANPQQDQSPQGVPSRAQAEQARQLAQQQRDLMNQLQNPTPNALQPTRQQELQRQTQELQRDLQQLAQQMGRNPQAQQAAQDAARSAQQAQQAMQQAQQEAQRGNQGQAQQARQQAAQQLERTAQQAQQAGQQTARQPGQQSGQQPGQALQQAQNQMNQAQNQLAQGRMQGAQNAMQQAAQALQQAAQQSAPAQGQQSAQQPGQPTQRSNGDLGTADGGAPDLSMFEKDLKQYAGKSWGELPGELRTRIIQDMKAKYGDDYGRVIKMYFEQIADTRARDR